jgi:hypothetical protein
LVNEEEINETDSSECDSPIMKKYENDEDRENTSIDISTDTSLIYEPSPAIN